MEGSYSKVWNAREEAPTEEYKFFVDSLMGTIRCAFNSEAFLVLLVNHGYRNEIASCEEAAYESLPLKDAATLLFFKTQSDLLKFARQVSWLALFHLPFIDHPLLIAWLASEPYRRHYHIRAERRRADRDTQREIDCGIPCIC
jgi:hypothetical protein